MNRSVQIILSFVVGIVAFLFFVLLLFPLDAVVNHYVANLEDMTKGAYRVSYSKIEPSLVFDTVFYNFRLEQKGKDAYDEVFFAPQINVGISLFSLLSQNVNSRFEADLEKNGNVSGHVELSKDKTIADLHFEKVKLESLGILKSYLKQQNFAMTLKGTLDGDVYTALGQTLEQTEADFSIKIAGLKLQDFNVNVQNSSFPVPDLVLSPQDSFALFEGNLDSGRLTLTNVSIPGSDLELQLKGRINFGRNFSILRSNLRGRFALSDMVFEKIPLLAIIKDYKTADGFFPLNIAGSSQKPQIRIGSFNLSDMLSF